MNLAWIKALRELLRKPVRQRVKIVLTDIEPNQFECHIRFYPSIDPTEHSKSPSVIVGLKMLQTAAACAEKGAR
jgi:hypothetical protein